MGLLISFLYLCLHIAIIIFVAYGIVWLFKWLGKPIDADVYKWGQIIVVLLIIIAVVVWLVGVFPPMGYGLTIH
jgi:cytochrome bd-type quinol oxidase subunit 2